MALQLPFGQNSGAYSPADVERQRRLGEALLTNSYEAKEPFGALAKGLMGASGGAQMAQASEAEQSGRANFNSQLGQVLADPNVTLAKLTETAGNPWMTGTQSGIIEALIGKQINQQGTASLPSSVEEYRFYASEELKANRQPMSYGEWMQTGRNGASGPQLGLQPQWGIGPDGEPVLGQMSSDGRFVPTSMPDGVTPMDPGSLAGNKAGAVVDAKTRAEAAKLLPGMEQAVAVTRRSIDLLRNNKEGMAEQFGNVGIAPWPQRWSPVIPGSARGNFLAELEQANGQAFMQARQMLKGAGQVTDYEGRRGEAAYSRMQSASETGDMQSFLTALEDFETAVADGYRKLQEVAGGTYAAGAPAVTGAGGADLPSGDALPTATNPETGEQRVFIDGAWVPADQVAR